MKCFLTLAALVSLSSSALGRSCGIHSEEFFKDEDYIVGGSEVSISDSVVSFQVFKSDEWANSDTWKHVCGGTLIDTRWVLTAAHCAKDFLESGTGRVAIGSVNITENSRDLQLIKVRRVHQYPKWTTPGGENDIALIELQKEVRLNSAISPACVKSRSADIDQGESCVALGWGRVRESAEFSTILKAVQINLLTTSQCLRAYRDMPGVKISSDNICAGRRGERGQGICQGDLGGPLLCRTDDGIALVGVATNGALCGSPQHPGVYLKTDGFIEWIQKITKNSGIGSDVEAETTTETAPPTEAHTPSTILP